MFGDITGIFALGESLTTNCALAVALQEALGLRHTAVLAVDFTMTFFSFNPSQLTFYHSVYVSET